MGFWFIIFLARNFVVLCVTDHYDAIAFDYDDNMSCFQIPIVDIIKHHVPLKKTDQILDIGGGTGIYLQLLRREFDMEKPGVCIDPSLKMLQVAMKRDGIIPIHSTAGEFLAAPNYPLDIVMMIGCVHHFQDPAAIFSNLAKYMSDEGTCIIARHCPPTSIFFSAFRDKWTPYDDKKLCKIIDSNNLNHKIFMWKKPVELSKLSWYKSLRGRYASCLSLLTDEEIEEGIRELEGKFGAEEIFKLDIDIVVIIVTKRKATV